MASSSRCGALPGEPCRTTPSAPASPSPLCQETFVSRTWSSSGPGGSRDRLLTVEETCWEVRVFNNGPRALSRTVPASGRHLRYTCGMGHLLGYGRVSAAEQNAEPQTDELTMAGCWRLAVPDVPFSGGAGSDPSSSMTSPSARCSSRKRRNTLVGNHWVLENVAGAPSTPTACTTSNALLAGSAASGTATVVW